MKTSKKNIILFFLIIFANNIFGQFLGGDGSGFVVLVVNPSSCSASAANPYGGGSRGGVSLVFVTPTSCVATSANPYAGGNGDGVTVVSVNPTVCISASANPYAGGNGDGVSVVAVSPTICISASANPYAGGNGDGVSLVSVNPTVCVSASANPYAGGNGDGVSVVSVNPTVCVSASANPYAGGIGDGVSIITVNPTVCISASANPYAGGSGDGFHGIQIIPTVCNSTAANPYAGGVSDGVSQVQVVECEPTDESELPISLIFFKGDCEGDFVILRWATASEKNNDYFTVKKSYDLNNWEMVCRVDGKLSSNSTREYDCSDASRKEGIIFYKLLQTDVDGETTDFDPIQVSSCSGNENMVLIMPNPASENLRIISNESIKKVKILSSIGSVVIDGNIGGLNEVNLNISTLPANIYHVVVTTNNNSFSLKFVKI